MKEKIDWRIMITGIVCLTALEITALLKGIDGNILSLVIGIIGFAIGFKLKR